MGGDRQRTLQAAGLEGTTLAGGARTRERLGRLLGVSALAHRGCSVAAAGWMNDHVEVEVEQPDGSPAILVLERYHDGRPGLLRCGRLNLGYRGRELHNLLETAIRRVAPHALATVGLEELAGLFAGDPEAGDRRQPLPMAPASEQRGFDDAALLSSWGAPGVWNQFFAVAEKSRGQLDSLDYFNRSYFVQHSDAECIFLSPQTGVPMVPLVYYPWEDRLRRIDWGGPSGRREPDPWAGRLVTTDLDEGDVILGRGPAKLDAALRYLRDEVAPDATSMVFCANTCVPVVSGEESDAAIDRYRPELKAPLLNLTTTPHSMQSLLRDLLVARRLRAEAAAGPPEPRAVNLVGFSEDPGAQELRTLLAELGISINVSLLPALGPELIDALPRASLGVFSPNELWQPHYAQLLFDSRTDSVRPAAPYGPEATRRWLAEVALAVAAGAEAERVDAVVETLWSGGLAEQWEGLVERARSHCLGIVVGQRQVDMLTDPAKTWGIPLLQLLREMGFQTRVLLHVPDDTDGERALAELDIAPSSGVGVDRFGDRRELRALLAGGGSAAVFTEHGYDRRLVELGLGAFSLQHFEVGLAGAVRSVRRLVETCEQPFLRRYGRYIARAAARRPGVGDAFGGGAILGGKGMSRV